MDVNETREKHKDRTIWKPIASAYSSGKWASEERRLRTGRYWVFDPDHGRVGQVFILSQIKSLTPFYGEHGKPSVPDHSHRRWRRSLAACNHRVSVKH
ncbi:hypothetical protein EVAR_93102_1 [Eumeta japonica]|uniref:Uncharacterized protein n=1 Tax=Eumeta variegata TaxID=151549 RepID=A0A4C1TI74_EUMVA|nr:hypothetical protein EVAR_93102_1 [Eumeta japonica]